MREVLIGQADYSLLVKIVSTTGAPVTGLVHTDIDLAYARVETDNDVTTSDVAPASLASLTAAHSDWGFVEVSAGDHPGLYRLDIADAVFASGAWEAVVTLTDASGTDFYAVDIGFRLVSFNAQDGVRLGLTALPNAAADAAGGLPISDAGGLDLDAKLANTNEVTAARLSELDAGTAGKMAAEVDLIKGYTDDIGAAGAGLTALGDARLANLDAAVSSRLASASYTAPPSASTIAAAVWDYLSASATTVGSLGKRIVDYLTGDIYARIGQPEGDSVSDDIAGVKSDTAAILDDTGTAGVVVAPGSKDGYSLAAAGLDQIPVTDPAGVSGMTTIPAMIVALWRRAFKKTTLDSDGNFKTYADNGSTVRTTETITDASGTQTKGAAS